MPQMQSMVVPLATVLRLPTAKGTQMTEEQIKAAGLNFQVGDFAGYFGDGYVIGPNGPEIIKNRDMLVMLAAKGITDLANALLENRLRDAVVVYGFPITRDDGKPFLAWHPECAEEHTHSAFIVGIRKVGK